MSCGGAFIRLWEKERGLLTEVPPCVVIEKETGEIKLYGAEAAALEDRVPEHLAFRRLFWADKILDRERLGTVFQLLLENEVQGISDRWSRPWQTQVLFPESMLPLHRRWLERTAREAGWWIPSARPAHLGLLRQPEPATSGAGGWRVQSFLDIGFSQTRLVVYVGNEVLQAVSTESFSVSQFCRVLVEFLQEKHHIEIAPSSFYDQNWTRTRLVFHRKKQQPQEWSLELAEWKAQQRIFWQELSEWVQQQTTLLSVAHRTEIEKREVVLVGGGAALWDDSVSADSRFSFRRASDAPYAQLRASFGTGRRA